MKRKERMLLQQDLQRQMQQRGRGTGRTADQIKHAPKNAVFVWCNDHTGYATDLAKHLGRMDLKIVGLSALERSEVLAGQNYTAVILDHAASDPAHAAADQMSQWHWDTLRLLRAWARPMEEAL